MPAPVSSSATTRLANKHPNAKPRPSTFSNKTRIVRRRGRAKATIESDEEIEREAGTDSESDDDHSSLDSASDSHAESPSRHGILNGHSRSSTPSTTHTTKESIIVQSNISPKVVINGIDEASFFGTRNWSEMVAEENASGPADLPVIEFVDFDRHMMEQPSQPLPRARKVQKAPKKSTPTQPSPSAPSSTGDGQDEQNRSERSVASSSRQPLNGYPKRPVGQTARQAYQQRLETDPSYVPTVGEFWGHDDRLLDKDLRSLSGWWRGRWQGRGRGRGGFDRSLSARGRGRGAFVGRPAPAPPAPDSPAPHVEMASVHPPDVAPIEMAWTHDGFEEMKRKEEHNHARDHPSLKPFRGLPSFRGARGVSGTGRGGRGGFNRGFTPSPSRTRAGLPFAHPIDRPWFAIKPERMWTKQHDAFLHFDPALKPRLGEGPKLRIKLPGDRLQIVKAASVSNGNPQKAATAPTASVSGSEDGEKVFVVRIPRRADEQYVKEAVIKEEPMTAAEPPIDDIFTVKPGRADRISLAAASTTHSVLATSNSRQSPSTQLNHAAAVASSSMLNEKGQQLELSPAPESLKSEPANPHGWIETEFAILRQPPIEAGTVAQQESPTAQPRPSHTVLPPLQTAFTPIPRTSPPFGSPFSYGHGLPPGIAMNQHGMPYELATGRAVYLQAPPPTMYTPRPVIQSHPNVSFIPGHLHHHSTVSPDFLSQPSSHTPPVNGFVDPTSGTPIFSLPRSSRVEIRAPTDQSDSKTSSKLPSHKPSGLRATTASFELTNSASGGLGYLAEDVGDGTYSASGANHQEALFEDGQATQNQQVDQAVMTYPFYQHHYYYPEAYGYSQYMDVSQIAPYELYAPDLRNGQSTLYY
jgi:hypothetical protein